MLALSRTLLAVTLLCLCCAAPKAELDGGATIVIVDAGAVDASVDGGTFDAGRSLDAGTLDSGVIDSGTPDAGPPIRGIADLHLHMMAEESFAGAWLHGSHTGVLRDCDGSGPLGDHARLKGNLNSIVAHCPNASAIPFQDSAVLAAIFGVGGIGASEYIGKLQGSDGDTGLHLGRRTVGTGWPRWDTIAHQQAWEGWVRDAFDGGIKLVVMSAVSFQFLCEAMPDANRKRPCSEAADVDLQLDLARAFVQRVTWAEIATSPRDARRIIGSGKLALVLSVEASNVFDETTDWRATFERFWNKGVRTLQIVHQQDNRFGGAALHNSIFHVAQYAKNCHIDTDCAATTSTQTLGFDVDANCRNTKGLTAEGEALVQEMMTRGMPIDLAHLSERGTDRVFALATSANYYPLYVSHGHFREVMNPELAKNEKTTPANIIRMVRQTGGLFGLRTAHDETRTYTRSGVANDCHGSSKSVAQAYAFGVNELKVNVAWGSDFNGFIQQTRPRFGPNGACSAGFPAEANAQRAAQADGGVARLGTDFDEKGLAHMGLLPDLVTDLQHEGVDTSKLEDTAEQFIRMWERAQSVRTGPADQANDVSTANVAPYVPIATRKLQYVCSTDGDCETSEYCGYGLNAGECRLKKAAGATCVFARECLSNSCAGLCL